MNDFGDLFHEVVIHNIAWVFPHRYKALKLIGFGAYGCVRYVFTNVRPQSFCQ